MGEGIALENGRISDFHGIVTLTLDWVMLHTFMHHSSTSTYIPYFIEIEETFCGRADRHFTHTLLGRLGGVNLKIATNHTYDYLFSRIIHNNHNILDLSLEKSCFMGLLQIYLSSSFSISNVIW